MKLANVRYLVFGLTLIAASFYLNPLVSAATYTWNKATGTQTFDNQANWGDGTTGFPNAIDDVADMSTLDITATQTINVTQSITLGELRVGDTVGTTAGSFGRTFANSGGAGAFVFQTSSGNARLRWGYSDVNNLLRTNTTINVPITLNSNTEFIADLQSSTSRNLYFKTGSLSGSGDFIVNAATRGVVAIWPNIFALDNYTGTFKYTSNGANGNMLQLAGTVAGVRNARQATLEMSVTTAGGSVWIFDDADGAILELGALRGDGVVQPFENHNGTLRTGYLSGTNTYSGVLQSASRFNDYPGGAAAAVLNYEKWGANSTQIFSGNNTYTGTTAVNEGTLLVNGTHTGGAAYSVASGATLGGTGSIGSSTVTVDTGGFLAPGASIESLAVGSATINGTLSVQYQGASIDVLNVDVSGILDITNATVDFSNLGGSLTTGAHPFATYGALGGSEFATVLNKPTGFEIVYNYMSGNQIALVGTAPTLTGDYNGNGAVDSADYVLWRKDPTNPSNGYVSDPIDGYNTWRANFGNPSGSGSELGNDSSGVPEPASLFLIMAALVSASAFGRRR